MTDKTQVPPMSRQEAEASKSVQIASDPKIAAAPTDKRPVEKKLEIGGPKGLEPTRYGDWEKGGRCIDF